MKARFLTLRIRQMWKRRRRRWGLPVDYVMDKVAQKREMEEKKKSKLCFTFTSSAMAGGAEALSKVIFLQFMRIQIEEEKMKVKFRTFYEKIVFMQKRMKDQIEIRSSKVEVLCSAWEQVYASIMRRASARRKDRNVLDFLQ